MIVHFQVKRVNISVQELEKKAEDQLDPIAAGGNVKESDNFVSSIASVLNDQEPAETSAEDIEESKKVHT